jgi:hypothetical protein
MLLRVVVCTVMPQAGMGAWVYQSWACAVHYGNGKSTEGPEHVQRWCLPSRNPPGIRHMLDVLWTVATAAVEVATTKATSKLQRMRLIAYCSLRGLLRHTGLVHAVSEGKHACVR